jgi:Brp/Blh family beta-carotene 15,15'-monooxygenase
MTPQRLARDHPLAFHAVALAMAAVALVLPIPFWLQLAGLVAVVAGPGSMHGALDIPVAARALRLDGAWSGTRGTPKAAWAMAGFAVAYLTPSALVILVWWLAPGLALAGFLGLAAIHFAGDWSATLGWPERLAAGTAAVALPALANEQAVAALFVALAPAAEAAALAASLHMVAWGALGVLGIVAAARSVGWRAGETAGEAAGDVARSELATLALLALAAPPLVYFAVYFGTLHAPRHFLQTADWLDLDLRAAARAARPGTLAPLAAAGLAGVALLAADTAWDAATLQTVFVGLAALTVPHMALGWWTQSSARARAASTPGSS